MPNSQIAARIAEKICGEVLGMSDGELRVYEAPIKQVIDADLAPVREALEALVSEMNGSVFGDVGVLLALRQEIGNTNLNCIERRLNEAEAALASLEVKDHA